MIDASTVIYYAISLPFIGYSVAFAYWSWRFAIAPYPNHVQTLGDVAAWKRREQERLDIALYARLTVPPACGVCEHARLHGSTLRCHRIAFPIEPAFAEIETHDSCTSFTPNEGHPIVVALLGPLYSAAELRFGRATRRPFWLRRLYAVLLRRHAP